MRHDELKAILLNSSRNITGIAQCDPLRTAWAEVDLCVLHQCHAGINRNRFPSRTHSFKDYLFNVAFFHDLKFSIEEHLARDATLVAAQSLLGEMAIDLRINDANGLV